VKNTKERYPNGDKRSGRRPCTTRRRGDFLGLGDFVAFKADGDSTSLSVFEGLIPSGSGPPPHIHHQQEEAFYVLEGTFSFLSGDNIDKSRARFFHVDSERNASHVQEYGRTKRQGFGG
jgi:uncharacterized cupin superfamily protein